jgi:hypothetical protein
MPSLKNGTGIREGGAEPGALIEPIEWQEVGNATSCNVFFLYKL